MRRNRAWEVLLFLCLLVAWPLGQAGCDGDDSGSGDGDSDSDSDGDSDSDSDTDTDADTDSDADSDTDADTDTDADGDCSDYPSGDQAWWVGDVAPLDTFPAMFGPDGAVGTLSMCDVWNNRDTVKSFVIAFGADD